MSYNLYRVSKACWAVKADKLKEVAAFPTVEQAAALLEELGVPSDEIDTALMFMAGQGHTHAQFGVMQGNFIFSDNEALEEKLGVA